jgi:hypothetical protein
MSVSKKGNESEYKSFVEPSSACGRVETMQISPSAESHPMALGLSELFFYDPPESRKSWFNAVRTSVGHNSIISANEQGNEQG